MSTSKTTKTRKVARHHHQKAELRERILVTARELILRIGFAELTIRKLAEAIGYAPGTIYLYFESRDEIVREICRRGFAEMFEHMKSVAGLADPGKRLAALLRAYADFALQNPETYRLLFMEDPRFTGEMFRSAPLERHDGPGWQAFGAFVNALRDLKRARKVARPEDENVLAEVLWTGVHGVVSLKLIYPAFPASSVDVLVNKMIQALMKGLR